MWLKPLISIVVIIFVAAVFVVVLNRPSTKEVSVNVSCTSFKTPFQLNSKMYHPLVIHLRGYSGKLERVTGLSIRYVNGRRPQEVADKSALTLNWDPATKSLDYPSIRIQSPDNNSPASTGPLTASLKEGTEIQPCSDDTHTCLKLISEVDGGVTFGVQEDRLNIAELNRLLVDELKDDGRFNGKEITAIAATNNNHELVNALFTSLPPRNPEASSAATLTFMNDSGEVSLADAELPQLQDRVLSFRACLDPDLLIDHKEPAKAIKGRSLDLTLDAKDFQIGSITVLPPPSAAQPSVLRVKGKGLAKSLKQDGHELVPTWLEEILDKPPQERGLWGLAALFCIFTGTVFLKRSMDVLAEIWIPKPEGKGDKS